MELKEAQQKIADKIKDRLEELGISKKQFAGLMKVQPSTVTKWLKGDHNFEMKTLMEIEMVLGINFFIYGE
jgi:transcriptional regulator with XRE-family HTH domain